MKYIGKVIQLTFIGLLFTLSASLALAAPTSAMGIPYDYITLAAVANKSAAAEQARARHGGKVLSVEEVSSGGGKAYRVKLLLEGGRIKIVTVEASKG